MSQLKRKKIKKYKKEDVERVIDAAAEFAKAVLPFGIDFTDMVKTKLKTQKEHKLAAQSQAAVVPTQESQPGN